MNRQPLISVLCLIALAPVLSVFTEEVVLKKGETLYAISQKYGVPVAVLQRINGISDDEVTRLPAGRRVEVPSYHVVEKGQTLYGLSRTHGIGLEELAAYNEMTVDTKLRIGQKVYLPKAPDAPQTSETAQISETADVLWPHPGQVEPLPGKLPGVVIHGTEGDGVTSVSNGRVKWTGPFASFGRVVLVKSESDLIYGYGGLDEILVHVGDKVKTGSEIGRLAGTTLHGSAKAFFFVHDEQSKPVDPFTAPRD